MSDNESPVSVEDSSRTGRWTWREHDAWWRERNAEYLAHARDESRPIDKRLIAFWAHCREEEARLAWKESEMLLGGGAKAND